jgi:hypothetical protein
VALKLLSGLYRTFLSFVRDYGFNLVNHAAASPWLRRSWSPNYSVLVRLCAARHIMLSKMYPKKKKKTIIFTHGGGGGEGH